MKVKSTITTHSSTPRPAAEKAERHVNPNSNEHQFMFNMDCEKEWAQKLTHIFLQAALTLQPQQRGRNP